MKWTAEGAALLARYACRDCGGTGFEQGAAWPAALCGCVCRRVFHVCHRRFRVCAGADAFARTVTFREVPRGVERRLMWIRRNEDYCADFQAAGRRALAGGHWQVFRFFHLLGGGPDLVAGRMRLNRTDFYRLLFEVETLVGRALAEMQPYSLYPPHEYMRGAQPGSAGILPATVAR